MKDILFDLDGTITDPMIGITKSVAYALKHFDIEVTDLSTLKPFIGPPLVDSFQEFYCFDKNQAKIAVTKYREYFKDKGLFENVPYDGIDLLLQKLVDEGYRLSIATSKPRVFALKILEHFNLLNFFTGIYGSELDGTRNDKKEVIEYAMNDLKISATDSVIMVGDRQHDIVGAHKNSIKVIAVLYGYGNLNEFRKYQADYIAKDLNEVYLLIKELVK